MQERVKGVMSKPCPDCGTERQAQQNADGSIVFAACESCQPQDSAQPAADPAESGETDDRQIAYSVPTREVGTDVDQEDD